MSVCEKERVCAIERECLVIFIVVCASFGKRKFDLWRCTSVFHMTDTKPTGFCPSLLHFCYCCVWKYVWWVCRWVYVWWVCRWVNVCGEWVCVLSVSGECVCALQSSAAPVCCAMTEVYWTPYNTAPIFNVWRHLVTFDRRHNKCYCAVKCCELWYSWWFFLCILQMCAVNC